MRTSIAIPTAILLLLAPIQHGWGQNWPRWRGPHGNGISTQTDLPVQWSITRNVCWKATLGGEGSSSPIVWEDRVFVTSAFEFGVRRRVSCLDLKDGKTLWFREIEDDDPEVTSGLTGHAAPTPVTDGRRVIAFFGNAGVVCYDFSGKQLWRRRFGLFDSELGLASSPILADNRVILLCDHDGDRFSSFDSFLVALDVKTGAVVWKTPRRGLFRSWSTPLLVPTSAGEKEGEKEMVVCAQDEVRGYDPQKGVVLWKVRGLTGWVTPSPVWIRLPQLARNGSPGNQSPQEETLVLVTSGKNGPAMAIRPGGRGDVTNSHVVWKHPRGAPYVCSPLCYQQLLYIHDENGVLTCREAATGREVYRRRLGGKYKASAVAGDGKVYIPSESGDVIVIEAGRQFRLLAKNSLGDSILASPAIAASDRSPAPNACLLVRTEKNLFCISKTVSKAR